jgi:hypothetical protein
VEVGIYQLCGHAGDTEHQEAGEQHDEDRGEGHTVASFIGGRAAEKPDNVAANRPFKCNGWATAGSVIVGFVTVWLSQNVTNRGGGALTPFQIGEAVSFTSFVASQRQ